MIRSLVALVVVLLVESVHAADPIIERRADAVVELHHLARGEFPVDWLIFEVGGKLVGPVDPRTASVAVVPEGYEVTYPEGESLVVVTARRWRVERFEGEVQFQGRWAIRRLEVVN